MQRHPVIPILADNAAKPVANPARRRVLQLMAASTALAGAGCSRPPNEKIMPYVSMPEGIVPGEPVFYASTLLRRGRGIGVLVETESGRPIKVEGNAAHPASLGALDAQAQASIMTLWDPDRSRTVTQAGQLATWPDLLDALAQRLRIAAATGGTELRLLTGPVTSPTLLAQIGEILDRYLDARWHLHDPADSDARAAAAEQMFGTPVRTLYKLDRAEVILSADADLFGPSADGVRNAHDFMVARRNTPRARLYALESSPNLCGGAADSRVALSPADMETALQLLATRLESGPEPTASTPPEWRWLDGLTRRLLAARGRCVVAAGESLSHHAHTLVWRINQSLGNIGQTVFALEQEGLAPTAPSEADARPTATGRQPSGLGELVEAMRAGQVETLVMLDVNPVYDTPGGMDFAGALAKVGCSVHVGMYNDETARRATWHMPMTHELEAWGDARAHDGTPSIIQPVIAPLYGGRSPHVLMNVLATGQTTNAHDRVRATWRALWQVDDAAFEHRWRDALSRGVMEDGFAPGSRPPVNRARDDATTVASGNSPDGATAESALPSAHPRQPESASTTLLAVFANDSNLITGEYANNSWLQELPRPYSKITWDNAALLSPATAESLALNSGDIVQLAALDGPARLLAPVWVLPGHADGVVTLPLGYGRPHAGHVGEEHGFDAYVLQDARDGVVLRTRLVTIAPTGRQHAFAITQHEMSAHGREPARITELTRAGSAKGVEGAHENREVHPSLYPEHDYDSYAWGMSVDLDACIGCNACTIACQAENNIPVVGPEQVRMGREMHWIRIDLYREDDGKRTCFQPMACQHCENAPCEVVCPVGATMHDSEGLNVQVYNRCVGTRFCSNNCPYKVRRFNFFEFSADDPASAAHANPDVTVRQRGVMEKCTYCVQRISHARILAQKEGRAIRDGDVVTACQATCPTGAIVFGDTNDRDSRVSRAKTEPRNYAVLDELNTRPRTTYLARLEDPAARLEDGDG